MKYTIRKFEMKDVDKIQRIIEEVDLFHHQLEPHKYNHPSEITRELEFFQEHYDCNDKIILIAELDDKSEIVGFIVSKIAETKDHPVLKKKKYGFIGNLGVKSDYQGNRIATTLLNRVQEWFEENNLKEIRLGVVAKNIAAFKLYQKLGYQTYIHNMVKTID